MRESWVPILAAISGDSLIHMVIVLVVVGLVLWLLSYLVSAVGLPEPFAKVAKVIILVIGVLFLINLLLSLIGHPIIAF